MKIRNGFVSNSSSSSFIVRIADDDFFLKIEKGFLASEEDVKKLEEYGFQKTNDISPFKIDDGWEVIEGKNKDIYASMRYKDLSNHDIIASFLIKNNIPFKASVHYDQQYWSYKKDSDYLLKVYNFGNKIDMYGEDGYCLKEIKDTPSYIKIPIKQYLKENE